MLGGGQSHSHGAVEAGDLEKCPGTLGATQLVTSKAVFFFVFFVPGRVSLLGGTQ